MMKKKLRKKTRQIEDTEIIQVNKAAFKDFEPKNLKKRIVFKNDGRYLIYYSFRKT